MPPVDAGVEERDRDRASVEAGEGEVRVADGGSQRPALERRRGDRSRVGDAHGIDALHRVVALEQRHGGRVERRREPREHMCEQQVRVDRDALQLEARAKQPDLREHAARPVLLLLRRCDAAVILDTLRERRRF
jgi:hypothetical protein